MIFIFLGLLNGFCITLSRVLNGQLSKSNGVFHASFINHAVGFLCLSLFYIFISQPFHPLPKDPTLYVGGIIGAIYVAVNSFVMARLSTTFVLVLVVSGQMLFSLCIEIYRFGFEQIEIQIWGACFIVVGVFLKSHLGLQKQTSTTSKVR